MEGVPFAGIRLMAWRQDDWLERHRRAPAVDPTVVREQYGLAARFVDVAGHTLDVYDVLEALRDTGVMLVRDEEGVAGDAARWAVMLVAADPLDVEPPVDTRWDREAEDRDAANLRPTRRRFEEDP
jgi:hypothetical protein